MNNEDAVERAHSLSSRPAELEAFLQSLGNQRAEVEAELRLARVARDALNSVEPRAEAAARTERQLLQLVGVLDARGEDAGRSPPSGPMERAWNRRWMLAAGMAAALLLMAVLLIQSGGGLGPTTAEAVLVEGSVETVTAEGVTLSTSEGTRTFSFTEGTELQDGFGNRVELSALQPGQIVVLIARPSDGVLVPQRVEIKDRLFGTLTAVTAESVTLQARQAQYLIRLSPQTEIEGRLEVGVFVEVDVEERDDGSFWAEEIEVEDRDDDEDSSGPGGGDDDDDDEDNSGPGNSRDR